MELVRIVWNQHELVMDRELRPHAPKCSPDLFLAQNICQFWEVDIGAAWASQACHSAAREGGNP